MKKTILLCSIFILAFAACQQEPQTAPVNLETEETAITNMLNKLATAFKEHDITTLASLITNDAIICGSDPSEFNTKKEILEVWKQMFEQSVELEMIGEPVVKVAPDGETAFAVQQYFMPMISEKLAFRNGYHLIKIKDEWLIFASNTACIPKNEDLPKINEILVE